MVTLGQLGNRICIIGPSNSGKSTLADKISAKTGYPATHLDQLAHKPFTDWQRRPHDEFIQLHDRVITADAWVIDGNYSLCMPRRFQRATSVIWLDLPRAGCILRYIKRCMQPEHLRRGGLDGAKKEFSLGLIRYTWQSYPQKKPQYAEILSACGKEPYMITSMQELAAHMRHWEA